MAKRVSLVVTVFNEEKTIGKLLDSLLEQTRNADEVVIVDAGSTDKTVELIKSHGLKSKVIVKKGISRAEGRNLGVKLSKNNIIAMTDAGTTAKKDWLENLIKPIKNGEEELVAAGFYDMVLSTMGPSSAYDMVGRSNLQKAMTVFLGVTPKNFNEKFLPSTRSIAFTKSAWKKVGGFPKNIKGASEDTIFNLNLVKMGVKIVRVKNARVEWSMPKTLFQFAKKIYGYAKGDAQSKIIYNEAKGLASHNIKVILVFTRYLLALALILTSIYIFPSAIYLLIFTLFFYLFWSFLKVFIKTGRVEAGVYGPLLQFASDFAVTYGFIRGILLR